MGRRDALRSGAPYLIAAVFVLLTVPPVLTVLGAGALERGASAWLEEARRVLAQTGTWRSVRFSVIQAVVSAALSIAIALPGAYFLSHIRFAGRRLVQSVSLLPFVLPSLIVILAIISFYGRSGVLNQLLGTRFAFVYSAGGIILAHVLFNISIALRMISAAWMQVDQRLREVSLSLGEGNLRRVLRLHLPLLLPAILNAATVIFLYCFVSFGVVLVFGGVRFATLEVRIYQAMFMNLNLSAAGALALLQLAVCGVAVFAAHRLAARRLAVATRGRRFVMRSGREISWITTVICYSYWVALGVFLFTPLASIALRAFHRNGRWSTAAFRSLIAGSIGDRDIHQIIRADFFELVTTSLAIAGLCAAVTTAAGFIAARAVRGRKVPWLDTLTMAPLAISGVTFSLGLRLLWFGIIPGPVLIIVAQGVMAFPLVFRILRTAMEGVPLRYTETAKSLGAGTLFRVRTLEIPVLWRSILNAYAFGFALSLADFTAVLTIGRGAIVTFPIAMYRLIGFQSFDVALALGVWYIIVVAAAFVAIDLTSHAREKEGL